jgi:hypothetical protein
MLLGIWKSMCDIHASPFDLINRKIIFYVAIKHHDTPDCCGIKSTMDTTGHRGLATFVTTI